MITKPQPLNGHISSAIVPQHHTAVNQIYAHASSLAPETFTLTYKLELTTQIPARDVYLHLIPNIPSHTAATTAHPHLLSTGPGPGSESTPHDDCSVETVDLQAKPLLVPSRARFSRECGTEGPAPGPEGKPKPVAISHIVGKTAVLLQGPSHAMQGPLHRLVHVKCQSSLHATCERASRWARIVK